MKKSKPIHMQFYFQDSYYCMYTFCGCSLFHSDILTTTQWDKCTCKNCLKLKKDSGLPG
jgi:hypothetical protein